LALKQSVRLQGSEPEMLGPRYAGAVVYPLPQLLPFTAASEWKTFAPQSLRRSGAFFVRSGRPLRPAQLNDSDASQCQSSAVVLQTPSPNGLKPLIFSGAWKATSFLDQFARAGSPNWGAGARRFESCCPDQN